MSTRTCAMTGFYFFSSQTRLNLIRKPSHASPPPLTSMQGPITSSPASHRTLASMISDVQQLYFSPSNALHPTPPHSPHDSAQQTSPFGMPSTPPPQSPVQSNRTGVVHIVRFEIVQATPAIDGTTTWSYYLPHEFTFILNYELHETTHG